MCRRCHVCVCFYVSLAKKDLRRCRSGMLNLAPTSTGSATAITTIFPELKGKLNGLAIRVPMLNASITDCVFEVILRDVSCQVALSNTYISPASGTQNSYHACCRGAIRLFFLVAGLQRGTAPCSSFLEDLMYSHGRAFGVAFVPERVSSDRFSHVNSSRFLSSKFR